MKVNKIVIAIAAASMASTGAALQASDANNTGADDTAGKLLVIGSQALNAFVTGNVKRFRGALQLIRDAIDGYLQTPETPIE